jgi:hypothetical protein
MAIAMERHIEWTSPAALWDHVGSTPDANNRRIFRAPAILRFASDSFMPELIDMMNVDPHRMHELLAVPETWSAPPSATASVTPPSGLRLMLTRARNAAVRKLEARSGAVTRRTSVWNAPSDAKPLKLYQPAHQRYYLVAAALVCRTIGLPDRPLDASKQEKASFVLRMLQTPTADAVNPDPDASAELAFVNGAWVGVNDRTELVAGEETHPLSPLNYMETDGRRRRLFNGFIPVGKRETFAGAKRPSAPDDSAAPIDSRKMLLKSQVLGPWASLEDVANGAKAQLEPLIHPPTTDPPTAAEKADVLARATESIQLIAWYILLDFRKWLKIYLRPVFDAIDGNSSSMTAAEQAVYDALGTISWHGTTLRGALHDIAQWETMLETVKVAYRTSDDDKNTASQWPSFKFQFVDATLSGASPSSQSGKTTRTALEETIAAALPKQIPVTLPDRVAAVAHANPAASPWFTVRCVFERPNCAALSPALVSDPSAAFQLAAFFDSDAPARPIRISMPVDTTPAGLRKFDKNAAFVMSDVLCGQVNAFKSASFGDLVLSVLPFPFHKDFAAGADTGPCPEGSGTVCSFSIPIITIVALILLMIFVKLLDIVFFWMPFFQVCLPVPKFEAKAEVKVVV